MLSTRAAAAIEPRSATTTKVFRNWVSTRLPLSASGYTSAGAPAM